MGSNASTRRSRRRHFGDEWHARSKFLMICVICAICGSICFVQVHATAEMAHAKTQRRKGGRADVIGGLSWRLCVLSEAGVRTMSRVRAGMGRVSREAAKDAKRDGRWAGADTQRKQGCEGVSGVWWHRASPWAVMGCPLERRAQGLPCGRLPDCGTGDPLLNAQRDGMA